MFRKWKIERKLKKSQVDNVQSVKSSVDTITRYIIGKLKNQQTEINQLNAVLEKMQDMQAEILKAYEERRQYDAYTENQVDVLFRGVKGLRNLSAERVASVAPVTARTLEGAEPQTQQEPTHVETVARQEPLSVAEQIKRQQSEYAKNKAENKL